MHQLLYFAKTVICSGVFASLTAKNEKVNNWTLTRYGLYVKQGKDKRIQATTHLLTS